MTSDFLKQAIEAENQSETRRKLVLIAIGSVLLMAVSGAAIFLWSQTHSEAPQRPAAGSGDGSAIPLMQTTTQAPEGSSSVGTVSPTQSTAKPSQKPTNQAYVPLPKSSGVVDHNAFVTDMQQVITTYKHIVSLVAFSPSDSDDFKVSRIRQALALEKQSFPAINPRTHLTRAGVDSGKYLELTELSESARAKIAVGLGSMEDWADDRSKTSYYSNGLGMVNQGVQILTELMSSVQNL